ncbi:protein O-mannosyl-transferase TMTC1-like isoform X2 [Leptidea sinapis]|nr:protein O-mannosyl-transferase TMTC1-like isoform X2 [Leptidea sinapis]
MLAKETGLTALLFNVAFDLYRCWGSLNRFPVRWRWKADNVWSRVTRGVIAFVLLALARLSVLQGSLPAFSPQDNPPAFHPSFSVRLMTFCYLAAFNWWLLLCPWTLSHDWQMGSVPLVTSVWDSRNLLTCAAVLSLLALLYKCVVDLEYQRHPALVAGVMLLVIPYLPASNMLVTVGFVIAERVLYIPSIGFVLITLHGVQMMWNHDKARRWLLVGITILVAGGAAKTYVRNRDWRTRESLLRADLAVLPHNAKLHYNFANFLKDIEQQENAIKHYKEALRLWPSYASAHNNLGTLVMASGRAEHHFLQALKYNRDHVNAHYNLAKLYRKKNRIADALKMLERCIAIEPRFVQAYLELFLVTEDRGKQKILDKLLELESRNWEHYHLYGNWLREKGLWPLSYTYYMKAIRYSFDGTRERVALPPLRAATMLLRRQGQRTRLLMLLTRWQCAGGGGRGAAERAAAAAALRVRTELAGRAAKYTRPAQVRSTCLHHSKLEIPASHKLLHINEREGTVNNSHKSRMSVSSPYRPTHNKSESGTKRSSCPINKKKAKHPDAMTSLVSHHLIKTY